MARSIPEPVLVPNRYGRNQTLLAVALIALGFLSFSICDAISKLLTRDLPPIQVAWFRHLGLLAVALWFLLRNGLPVLRTRHPILQVARSVVASLSSTAMIIAFAYVPLADAIAVTFSAPFMVTLVGAIVLHEPVGLRRWAAMCIAFTGTLVVVRPGFGDFHPALFLVVAATIFFAARQILSRAIGATDPTVTTITYTAVGSTLILSGPMVVVWQSPVSAPEVILLAGVAISYGAGEVLLIRSFELARAASLSPVQYTQIVWGTILGWLIFSQLPDVWTMVGGAITMAAGAYALQLERSQNISIAR